MARDALEQAPGGGLYRPAWAMGLGQRWGWPRPG